MKELYNELKQYLEENHICYKEIVADEEVVIQIGGVEYQLFEPAQGKIFDEVTKVYFDREFKWKLDITDYDGYVIKFGGVWYTFKKGEEREPNLKKLKWIGECDDEGCNDFPYYLGVHGPMEILNGTGSYKDWAKKAKFLKIKRLGLCERATLAGVFKFQSACKKEKITPIFGMEIPIKNEEKDLTYSIKLFAKNEEGWQNLLQIERQLNVEGKGFFSEKEIELYRQDTFLILDPKSQSLETVYKGWNKDSEEIYYQFDTVVYNKEERDKEYLLNLQKFYKSKIRPIAFCDSYYTDQEYVELKRLVNRVAGKVYHESDNQYFKPYFKYLEEVWDLCKDEEKFDELIERACSNLEYVAENCNFEIETMHRHLPKYTMTDEESKKWSSNKEMFEDLVFEGIEERSELLEDYSDEEIAERIEKEIEVIERGDLVDYFLILRDIVNWSRKNGILLGAGRGSGAGSLVNYLLGLTQVNPLKYSLLFERFLNEGRLFRKADLETVVCVDEKGTEHLLDPKQKYEIRRGNKKLIVRGEELQQEDEIINL